MGSMAPASLSRQVLSVVVTVSLVMSLVDGVDSSCRPTIKAKQNYTGSLGQPLTLKCIMQFCDPGLPNISLCKITGDRCDPVTSREGINISMEGDEKSNAVYVLIFNPLQMNDTGYYQCKAIHDKQRITGNTMKISLSGEISAENIPLVNTTNSGNSTNVNNKLQNFKLLLYIMSSLGGACVFIIIISLLVYCQRQLGGKHKSLPQEPAPTEETEICRILAEREESVNVQRIKENHLEIEVSECITWRSFPPSSSPGSGDLREHGCVTVT
ncbi:B- and T-lymphocyte attenuator isoform X2 [Engystomops pustulosus]|uniref:B- and T-lymphocyte attenuator isoform X2 n=1 Tax=Engystomops pustulosus TaxID=76066 RepID=UPI003AFA6F4D